MEVKKTVRVKLHYLTNNKRELLEREYRDFQKAVDGESSKLYSATEQQAEKVRRQKNPKTHFHIRVLTLFFFCRDIGLNSQRSNKK
ncbi:hypothetical protein AKJ39_05195 [candidate division MSBL1 archaeon SCGC-AAA259J03]|uniref:Uncharacterized protein n=1 Tax=candidate division MSBL1 archaeon SCGC-AAA259J03 TaxID=1698269 RepID=A0A656YUY1_9EURY|nr:hypothetical protein AKJ39_05195 [candidate division MSBL1 archaeon SCGC-AAA259J03]